MAAPPLPFGYTLRSPSPLFVPPSIPSSSMTSPSPQSTNFPIKVEDYISNSTPYRSYLSISSTSSSASSSSSSTPNSLYSMPTTTRGQTAGTRRARAGPSASRKRSHAVFQGEDDSEETEEDQRRKRRRLVFDDFQDGFNFAPLIDDELLNVTTNHQPRFPSATEADIIDLTDDPNPLATHTEREVQAARTLESLRRKGQMQRDRLAGGAASSSNLGSRDRPILLDDADEVDDDLSRRAEVHQEILRQQEVAAMGLSSQEGNKRTTFNNMNCVICMDTPTDLTMTACGHVFCHVCIQEALKHSENQQRDQIGVRRAKCPMCRKTINRNNQQTLVPLLIMKGKRKDKSGTLNFVRD